MVNKLLFALALVSAGLLVVAILRHSEGLGDVAAAGLGVSLFLLGWLAWWRAKVVSGPSSRLVNA